MADKIDNEAALARTGEWIRDNARKGRRWICIRDAMVAAERWERMLAAADEGGAAEAERETYRAVRRYHAVADLGTWPGLPDDMDLETKAEHMKTWAIVTAYEENNAGADPLPPPREERAERGRSRGDRTTPAPNGDRPLTGRERAAARATATLLAAAGMTEEAESAAAYRRLSELAALEIREDRDTGYGKMGDWEARLAKEAAYRLDLILDAAVAEVWRNALSAAESPQAPAA